MIPNSIKFRLQLWYGILLAVALGAFGVMAYQVAWEDELQKIDRELVEQLDAMLRSSGRGESGEFGGGPPPGPRRERGSITERVREAISRNIAELHAANLESRREFYYLFLDFDGTVFARSPNAPATAPIPGPAIQEGRRKASKMLIPFSERTTGVRTRGNAREAYRILPLRDAILAGRSLNAEMAVLNRRSIVFAVAGLVLLAAGLLGGWWLAGRAMRPIETISEAAGKIATGDLGQRIRVEETETELGKLATVLNHTFARLEEAFSRQARFTADASHEMRTPISVILTKTQTALARERQPSEYQEALRVCQRAAARMRSLTESLLALSRMDAAKEQIGQQQTDWACIAREAVEMFAGTARERGMELKLALDPARLTGDPERLLQVATNLIGNAIQFTPYGGTVTIRTQARAGSAVLEVSDTGPGISSEALPYIFDRFYRGDKSRTGDKGSGLGLSIARAAVEAHSGNIQVSSKPGQGATFTVSVPASVVS
jgi:heavy metal sensor kinase